MQPPTAALPTCCCGVMGTQLMLYPKWHHVILLISANVTQGTWGNFWTWTNSLLSSCHGPVSIVSANLLACLQKLRLTTSISVSTSLRRHLGVGGRVEGPWTKLTVLWRLSAQTSRPQDWWCIASECSFHFFPTCSDSTFPLEYEQPSANFD